MPSYATLRPCGEAARASPAFTADQLSRLRPTGERPRQCVRFKSAESNTATVRDDSEAVEAFVETTLPAQLLEPQDVLNRMYFTVHPHADKHYHAFYSTELGGITIEPAFMMIHMDDHMVHRGHAVFDTAHLVEGKLYLLDQHLRRLEASAAKARIELPCSLPQLKRIIMETAAASMRMDGRGGFGISPSECMAPTFYCLVTSFPEGSPVRNPGSDYLRGRKVNTSPVPIKDPYFATLKSNNYLANVLSVMDAEDNGYDYGIFVDNEGYFAEGATMNVAILTQEGELVIPPFESALGGITAMRLMELIPEHAESLLKDTRGMLSSVVQRKFNKQDVYEAREAMLIGSTTYVTSIIRWDDMDKGEGAYGDQPGVVSLVLRALLKKDLDPLTGPPENFTEVPYGYVTNMED